MNESLLGQLKDLKLYYLQQNLDDFASSFKTRRDLCLRIIENICEREIDEKKRRNLERRVREVRVGSFKPISDFDWDWPKFIERNRIEELLELGFVGEKKNAVIMGPQGVGKTMIAKNIAHLAATSGKTSLFTTASELVIDMRSAYSSGIYRSRLRKYLRPSLLVIDELGYLSFDHKAADILFEVISKRYENSSVIITSNLAFNKWGSIFPGATCTTALVDRLTHHCEILTIDADSFRVRESKENENNTKKRKKK